MKVCAVCEGHTGMLVYTELLNIFSHTMTNFDLVQLTLVDLCKSQHGSKLLLGFHMTEFGTQSL